MCEGEGGILCFFVIKNRNFFFFSSFVLDPTLQATAAASEYLRRGEREERREGREEVSEEGRRRKEVEKGSTEETEKNH